MNIDPTLLVILIILGLIEIILIVAGILDWLKQPETMPNRYVWLVIICLISGVGPIIYFLLAPRGQVPPTTSPENDVWR